MDGHLLEIKEKIEAVRGRYELNRRRTDLRANLQDRLTSLCAYAVECVGNSLEAGDTRTALNLLRGLGLLSTGTIGASHAGILEGDRMQENMAAALRQTSFV